MIAIWDGVTIILKDETNCDCNDAGICSCHPNHCDFAANGTIPHLKLLISSELIPLAKYATSPVRVHDGNIITLHSWCSDGFYITCDREAMRYVASNHGINRKMMAETMSYPFGEVDKLPKTIQ